MAANKVWGGFVLFAAVLLLVNGMINIFQGLIALIDDQRLVLSQDKLVVVDTTGYGWVLLISGVLLLGVGCGLVAAQTWARIVGIIVVGLHLVTQVAWLGAYPVWSLLMIALDVLVLFALTARWRGVKDEIGTAGEPDWSENPVSEAETSARVGRPIG
jgi:hypothetical protein